jgi:hypothetical protein
VREGSDVETLQGFFEHAVDLAFEAVFEDPESTDDQAEEVSVVHHGQEARSQIVDLLSHVVPACASSASSAVAARGRAP